MYYWSSTECSDRPGRACGVLFDGGYTDNYYKNGTRGVRAVLAF